MGIAAVVVEGWAVAILLGGLAVLATFAAGLVLFIVGLVRKRTGLWVTGIILVLLSMVPPAGVLLVWPHSRSRSAVKMAPSEFSEETAAPQALPVAGRRTPEQVFLACSGLELPVTARVVSSHSAARGPEAATCNYLKLTAGPDFGGFLEAHFTKAQWADVQAALTHPDALSCGVWKAEDVRGKAYYTREYRNPNNGPDRMVSAVAYDANAGTVYLASEQKQGR